MERRETPWRGRLLITVSLPYGEGRRADIRTQDCLVISTTREGRPGDGRSQWLGAIIKARGGTGLEIINRVAIRCYSAPSWLHRLSRRPRMESRSGRAAPSRVVAPCRLAVSLT